MTKQVETKSRGILFKGPLVRAILENRKTQTRRIIKPQPEVRGNLIRMPGDAGWCCIKPVEGVWDLAWLTKRCPHGVPGDLLYVREACWIDREPVAPGEPLRAFFPDDLVLFADGRSGIYPFPGSEERLACNDTLRKCSPIHMPRWASRLTLRIVDVRVQRLQEISEEEADAEGVGVQDRATIPGEDPHAGACSRCGQRRSQHVGTVRACFGGHGTVFNASTFRGGFAHGWNSINGHSSWESNPWVWAITFERIAP